jgi:hypothetical protein
VCVCVCDIRAYMHTYVSGLDELLKESDLRTYV